MSVKGAIGSASIEDNMSSLDLENVDWLGREHWPATSRKTGWANISASPPTMFAMLSPLSLSAENTEVFGSLLL